MKKNIQIHAVTKLDNSKLTDTATAYLSVQLSKIAYQALQTNFARGGNPYVLEVLSTFGEFMTRQNNGDYRELVNIEYSGVKMMVKKHHEFIIKNGIRIPIRPYDSLELTDAGRQYITDTKKSWGYEPCVTFDDCFQQAWLAAMELNKLGLLSDFDSIWNLKHIVYRAVNNLFKRENRHNQYSEFSLDETERKPQEDVQQSTLLDSVECAVMLDELRQRFAELADKHTDNRAFTAWTLCKIDGYKQREVAEMLNCKQQQVARWTKQVQIIVDELYTMFA